jgi:hypothetical protein
MSLNCNIYLPLAGGFGLPHEVLAVGEVTADLATYHHAQFVDGELGTGSVVPPVIVVRAAYRIVLVRVLVFYHLLADAVLDLHIIRA